MSKELISGVPETMLQTLYARALETKTNRHYVDDPKALEIVEQLDYDFSKAKQDKTMRTGVIARTILLDQLTHDFLTKNPQTCVINIACGLDTRCYRMKGLYQSWYNLDLPETMAIRSRFFKETDAIKQIASSAMDETWTNAIPKMTNVLIIIEGLSMYLKKEDIEKIFKIIDNHFENATIFFEVMNPWIVKNVKEKSIEGSSAKFTWGIKNGHELIKLIPNFNHISDHSLTQGMQVFIPIYKILGKIPFVANISNKIIILEHKKSLV